MDEEEEYVDNRDELLKRFRESLEKPMSERYFDEDDLIEIFDYAGDLNDDYLRMEALMCGARYFPDSQELLERRGIFYSQYSDDTGLKFVDDHQANSDSLILYLLSLRHSNLPASKADKELEKILKQCQPMNDEEVIQFVDLAATLNRYDWLKQNIDKIKAKAQYPSVVIYEIAMNAEIAHDYAYSAALLEELTEIEPFNSYYWTLLARQYASLDETEKAISAIDYSLAIKPDSMEAMLVKAKLMYVSEQPIDNVIALVKKALKIEPGYADAARFLATVYNSEGNADMARQTLQKALEKSSPGACDIISDLILYHPDNIDALLDEFYANCEDNSQMAWATWAQQLSQQGFPDVAKAVVKCYERNAGIRIPSLFAIEDLFVAQDFEETIAQLNDYIKNVGAAEADFPSVVAMHVISMVRQGEFYKAYAFCDFFENNIDITKYQSVSNRLEYIGLVAIIHHIKEKIARSTDPTDWEDFDPLQYWTD